MDFRRGKLACNGAGPGVTCDTGNFRLYLNSGKIIPADGENSARGALIGRGS